MPKYFGLGPALTVRTGTTKRRPSAEATSPPPQACASGIFAWASTNRAVGADQGLGPDVVLLDPGQPAARQRRGIRTDQRFQADVARLGQQHGAQADREVG